MRALQPCSCKDCQQLALVGRRWAMIEWPQIEVLLSTTQLKYVNIVSPKQPFKLPTFLFHQDSQHFKTRKIPTKRDVYHPIYSTLFSAGFSPFPAMCFSFELLFSSLEARCFHRCCRYSSSHSNLFFSLHHIKIADKLQKKQRGRKRGSLHGIKVFWKQCSKDNP